MFVVSWAYMRLMFWESIKENIQQLSSQLCATFEESSFERVLWHKVFWYALACFCCLEL